MSREDNKPKYYPEWSGPRKDRNCTDVPCLVIFVVFMICWAAVGYYALTYGNIKALVAPRDSKGRKCGIDVEVANEPYMLFFDLTKCLNTETKCETPQVCRENCPSSNWFWEPWDFQSLNYIHKHIICETGIDVNTKSKDELRNLLLANKCAEWFLNSTSIMRRCIPRSIPIEFINVTMSESDLQDAQKYFKSSLRGEEIIRTAISIRGTMLLALIAGGAAVCQIYILLLKWFALPLVILSVIIESSFFSYLSYYFHLRYVDENETIWLSLTIVFAIVTGLILLIVICLLKKIRLACQLIKEVGKGATSITSTLFFPLIPWLLHLAAIIYAIIIGLYLSTIETEKTWQFVIMVTIHIVGFLWIYCFITALGEIILAGIFASWYWMFGKHDVPFYTIAVTAWRTFRYNLGTLVFGSLLIAFFRLIRYLLVYVTHCGNASRRVLNRFLVICTLCLMGQYEKMLSLMNRNTYIFCAIYGKGLLSSASDAMALIMSNDLQVIDMNNIVFRLLGLINIGITTSMGVITWWYCTTMKYEMGYWWAPVIIVVVGVHLAAFDFFSVYDVAIDTIFLCFLEDCERNDGSQYKPYFMSRQLRKLLYKNPKTRFEHI